MTPSFISAPALAYRLLPRVEPGRALAHSEWLVLATVAEALLQGGPLVTPPEVVADNVERFLIEGRSRRAWRCRVLLHLIEWSPWPTRGRRFSELTPSERRRLVEERYVGGGHLYRLCAKVRYLVLMGAYGDEQAARATGYVPLEERARFRPVPPGRQLTLVSQEEIARPRRPGQPKPTEGPSLAP